MAGGRLADGGRVVLSVWAIRSREELQRARSGLQRGQWDGVAGHDPTAQGAVVYVLSEGTAGIKNRTAAYRAAHPGIDTAKVFFLATNLNLLDPGAVLDLIR